MYVLIIVYDNGWDWVVYLKSVENNIITLGKLIGLLFLFCLPLLSILFLKIKRNAQARPVMGTIFLVVYHGFEGLSLITVPIHEGEAQGRGQLSFDNPDFMLRVYLRVRTITMRSGKSAWSIQGRDVNKSAE